MNSKKPAYTSFTASARQNSVANLVVMNQIGNPLEKGLQLQICCELNNHVGVVYMKMFRKSGGGRMQNNLAVF